MRSYLVTQPRLAPHFCYSLYKRPPSHTHTSLYIRLSAKASVIFPTDANIHPVQCHLIPPHSSPGSWTCGSCHSHSHLCLTCNPHHCYACNVCLCATHFHNIHLSPTCYVHCHPAPWTWTLNIKVYNSHQKCCEINELIHQLTCLAQVAWDIINLQYLFYLYFFSLTTTMGKSLLRESCPLICCCDRLVFITSSFFLTSPFFTLLVFILAWQLREKGQRGLMTNLESRCSVQ